MKEHPHIVPFSEERVALIRQGITPQRLAEAYQEKSVRVLARECGVSQKEVSDAANAWGLHRSHANSKEWE